MTSAAMVTFQKSVGGESRSSCRLPTIAFPFRSQCIFEGRVMSHLKCDRTKQIDQYTFNNTVLTDFVVTFSLFFDSLPASPLINDSLPTEFSLEAKTVSKGECSTSGTFTLDTRRCLRDPWKQIRTTRMSQHRRSKLVSCRFHRSLVAPDTVYSNGQSWRNRNDWISIRNRIAQCNFHRFDRSSALIQQLVVHVDSSVVTRGMCKQISIHRRLLLRSSLTWGFVRCLLTWPVYCRARWYWPRRLNIDSCTLQWINYSRWSTGDGFVEVWAKETEDMKGKAVTRRALLQLSIRSPETNLPIVECRLFIR